MTLNLKTVPYVYNTIQISNNLHQCTTDSLPEMEALPSDHDGLHFPVRRPKGNNFLIIWRPELQSVRPPAITL